MQRYLFKFWRLFDSSHTGFLPYHEVIAFEILVCKGARRAFEHIAQRVSYRSACFMPRAPRSTFFANRVQREGGREHRVPGLVSGARIEAQTDGARRF